MRGRTVIVRRLPADFVVGEARRQLELATRALAELSHPNVIRLFEVGDDEGRLYLVFEHLKGQSLRLELSGHPLRVRRAVQLAIQIGDAVADAHGAGYLHCGLSPESVVITVRGHAKIPAHELACRHGFDASSNPPSLRDYRSPEEEAGEAVDERSDVFSVGAILFEMLTARRPSPRGSARPSGSNAHVPELLDDVCLRAVAPKPALRIGSVAALVQQLRAVDTYLDEHGSADDEDFGVPLPRRRVNALVVVLGLVALVAAAWWWWAVGGGQ
jgi:serine/threonine-protein kinase